MSDRHRILLITPNSPFSPQSGAEQRTALLYEALSQLGRTDVLIVAPVDLRPRPKMPKDSRIIGELRWRPSKLGMDKYSQQGFQPNEEGSKEPDYRQYDLIVGRYLNPICKLHLPHDVPTLVDLDDWRKSYGADDGLSPTSIARHLKQAYAAWLAKRQLKRFSGFYFVSERDRDTVAHGLSASLPNIPFSPPGAPMPDTANGNILFVGALWYPPNAQGIDRFLASCWLRIRAAMPAATLTLVGAAPPCIRKEWESYPGVAAPGFVEDLGEAYRSASFTIAPIYFGGGTNIKIVESLAYGRACITTPHCATAFQNDLIAGNAISVATSDDDFAERCIALLNNAALRCQQAAAGYELVSDRYNRSAFTRTVLALAEQALQRRPIPS